MKTAIHAALCILFFGMAANPQSQPARVGNASNPFSNNSNLLVVDGTFYSTLSAALADCPPTGCVVFDSVPEIFSSNPFKALKPDAFAEVHLLRQTWITNAEIIVPTKSQLYGAGRGDATTTGTVIQAGPAFPASTPVVEMSTANPGFAVRIENLTVDCSNIKGAIGIQNLHAQEESGVRHALVVNCPGASLDIEGSSAQNSGPYDDLELLDDADCTNCTPATVPLVVKEVVAFRGVHGATINSDGAAQPEVGAQIDSSGSYNDLHFEHVTAGVVIGSKLSTANVLVSNVYCSVPNTDCVTISGAFASQNITAVAIASNGTNLIADELHGNTLSVKGEGGSVGMYAIGNGMPRTVFTTSANYKLSASLVTTAANSDAVKIPGMTPRGHCAITPTNADAARDGGATFISAKAKDQITVSHPPKASRNWDIECSSN